MGKSETKYIDISPHRSILTKISQTGYSIQEAISELIDNAIDARIPKKKLKVSIDINEDSIVISDNGTGMTEEQTGKSIRLGFSEKKGQLGEFGLGLKTATSFLGKGFTLKTSTQKSSDEYVLEYDEKEWLKKGDWNKYPLVINKGAGAKKSGTTVIVKGLKVNFSDKLLTNIINEFGVRFGPFIKNKELELLFNGAACVPFVPNIISQTKNEFAFKFKDCRAWGWWGYQLSGLNKSYYGFHTYRRGRLVTTFDKIGLTPNQDVKQIIGDLHIEGVPITHDKKGWLKSSKQYKEIEKEMRSYFKPYEKKPRRVLSGFAASSGKVIGKVRIIHAHDPHIDLDKEIHKVKRGDIIVTEMTRPAFLLAIRRSAGIITNLGGNLCHAAIVSREFNIPAVVGTQRATTTLKEGETVILDGHDGYVYED